MKQAKQNIPAINLEGRMGLLVDQENQSMKKQSQKEIINTELFKTATFFDPETLKEMQKVDQTKRERNPRQTGINIVYSPRETFKSSQTPPLNHPTQNSASSVPNNWNNYTKLQNSTHENNANDKNSTVSHTNSGLLTSSTRKRPLLAFKLSHSSTRAHQLTTEEKIHETDFDFIQSVQDAEFWNKVNMIISENEENNQNQGRLVTLPSINQKGESAKRPDKINKKFLNNNSSLITPCQQKGSSCSTRDSLRQNQQQFKSVHQSHIQSSHPQEQQQQQQQQSTIQISQQAALLKKQYHSNSMNLNKHLNHIPHQKASLLGPSSINLKNSALQTSSATQNQHSFHQDSIRTEESAYILSPESTKIYASPQESFNPSSLSTNANSSSFGAPTLGQSQSLSFFNSQISQTSTPQNQPYFQNSLFMSQKSPTHDTAMLSPHNFYSIQQQNHLSSEEFGKLPMQNLYSSLQTQQSERQLQREIVQLPQHLHKSILQVPLKFGSLQQRFKRDGLVQAQQSSQNEMATSLSSKKSQMVQSHKLLSSYKNEDTINPAQETKKRGEWKQNILLKDSAINQLNGSMKRQQFEQFQSPTERLNTNPNTNTNNNSNNINIEQFDNYNFLKCNENIANPNYQSLYNQHRLFPNENTFNQNSAQKIINLPNNKIEDHLRRSMQKGANVLKDDFSFCEDGSNNLMKISQSAQGYREQAKKINLRSKQQENLVKKLFKIDDKSQIVNNNSAVQNNYFNSQELSSSSQQKQKRIIKPQSHQ